MIIKKCFRRKLINRPGKEVDIYNFKLESGEVSLKNKGEGGGLMNKN